MRFLVPLAAALALGACAAAPEPETAGSGAPEPAPQAEIATRPPHVPAEPPPEEPPPTVSDLIGLKADEVAELLGTPGFRRQDKPAEIWQYNDSTCTLDLFLYTDAKGTAPYSVAHVEVRSRTLQTVSREECLRRLVKARRAQRAG